MLPGTQGDGLRNRGMVDSGCCGRRVGQVATAWIVTSSSPGVQAEVGEVADERDAPADFRLAVDGDRFAAPLVGGWR